MPWDGHQLRRRLPVLRADTVADRVHQVCRLRGAKGRQLRQALRVTLIDNVA
jgi:hypothetical protein